MKTEFLKNIPHQEDIFDIDDFDILSKSIYQNYFKSNKLNKVCFSQFYTTFLAYIARSLSLNQVCITGLENNADKIPLNIYCFQFLKSGAGKGKTKNIFDNIFSYYQEKYEEKYHNG